MDRIRIFIGTEPKTYIAQRVLEHSIRRHTQAEVEFTPMIGPEWEYPIEGIKVGTGFSLRRWMIPGACGFKGKAIYLDADQVVFGDISKLWHMDQRPGMEKRAIYVTYQVDKYSPQKPVPQTSVMLIDCDLAIYHKEINADGWDIEKILEKLRRKPDATTYGQFMHAEWIPDQLIGRLPTEWNHLNVYEPNKTRLLHYTKEPEQPWYKPDHPLSHLWEEELRFALREGYVTEADLLESLDRWNVQEDWRKTNGLHPYYRKYVGKRNEAQITDTQFRQPPQDMKVLWVTSFAKDMLGSGKQLLDSFTQHNVPGAVFVGAEGFDVFDPTIHAQLGTDRERTMLYPVDQDSWLLLWLTQNADIIPKHLGGQNDGVCRCPGGPLEVHDKKHKLPCIGHWFCRNASRWFRKIVTQRAALEVALRDGYTHLIWVDADCRFKKPMHLETVRTWFKNKAMFFLKNKREFMEAGVIGFDLTKNGHSVMQDVIERFRSGEFRQQKRWDDCITYQWCIDRAKVPAVDIAFGVGDHAAVVPYSPLSLWIEHDKGRHGRKQGIMT